MDRPEGTGPSAAPLTDHTEPVLAASVPTATTGVLNSQPCTACGTVPEVSAAALSPGTLPPVTPGPVYIYAVGSIEARFPRHSVEREYAQAVARIDATGLTDRQTLQTVLSKPENRYLVRQMCWVMTIQGLETYVLATRDSADFGLLVETQRADPAPSDLDVVIGVRGPIAPPDMCNGLLVPIVIFDQIYSFPREAMIESIPRPDSIPAEEFRRTAEELFDRIVQIAGNAGATDRDRAINYLLMRYPRIYEIVAEAHSRNESLNAVDVLPSPLSGTHKVMDVIFSFTNRGTDVISKQHVAVEVSDMYPYLHSKVKPYYDR